MCTNSRWIYNKYNGKYYFMPCHHCFECEQDKQRKNFERIQNHFEDQEYFSLFVLLTYSNAYIPYIRISEINDDMINVWRDNAIRKRYNPKTGLTNLECHNISHLVDFFPYNSSFISKGKNDDITGLRTFVGSDDPDKIAVCISYDFTRFIDRLKLTLKRYYHLDASNGNLSYYRISEYGPTTFRPHFHVMFSFPKGWAKYYSQLRRAIISSWPYCDWSKSLQKLKDDPIQIALFPASYVSKYAVRPTDYPSYLTESKISAKHSFSRGYGFGNQQFVSTSIFDKVRRGDFRYSRQYVAKDGLRHLDLRLPTYVFQRYFPYIKGLSSLDMQGISSILQLGSSSPYYSSLGLEGRELLYTSNRLEAAFLRSGLSSRYEYAQVYIDYLKKKSLYTLGQFYQQQEDGILPFNQSYDNPWAVFQYINFVHHRTQIIYDTDYIPSLRRYGSLGEFTVRHIHPNHDAYPYDKSVINIDPNTYYFRVISREKAWQRYSEDVKRAKTYDVVTKTYVKSLNFKHYGKKYSRKSATSGKTSSLRT